MKKVNNRMGVGLKNIQSNKAKCSLVLVPQSDPDGVLLERMLSEGLEAQPVTITDLGDEVDGHDEPLRRGYRRGVRVVLASEAKPDKPEPEEEAKKPKASKRADKETS